MDKIEEKINKIIEEWVKSSQRPRIVGELHASEVGFCSRKIYYYYILKEDVPLDTLKIFEAGRIIHTWFSRVLQSLGTVIMEGKIEKPMEGFRIVGSFDDMIMLKNKKDIIFEIKSVRSLSRIKEPLSYHVMQINFYMKMLNITDGYIIYIDRRNLQHKMFHIVVSDELFNKLLERAKKLHEHIKNRKIPPAEARLNKNELWQCQLCPFAERCDKDGIGGGVDEEKEEGENK